MSAATPIGAWSRRRAAVAAEAEALVRDQQNAEIAEQHAALAEKTEAEVLAELDLPNPDDMQAGDDFSAFMKSAVPAALRNRALRRLWLSNPVLANVDMLVDYGEDFTGKNDPIRLIKTIYRVGKGMVPDEPETPDPQPEVAVAADVAADVDVNEPEPVADDTVEDAPHPIAFESPTEKPAPALAPRRRMRFEFSEGALPLAKETEMT